MNNISLAARAHLVVSLMEDGISKSFINELLGLPTYLDCKLTRILEIPDIYIKDRLNDRR